MLSFHSALTFMLYLNVIGGSYSFTVSGCDFYILFIILQQASGHK